MIPALTSFFVRVFRLGSETGPLVTSGTGSPEAVVTAPVSSMFHRTDGGTDTAVYRKETGAGNTGWVAIAATAPGSGLASPAVLARTWFAG